MRKGFRRGLKSRLRVARVCCKPGEPMTGYGRIHAMECMTGAFALFLVMSTSAAQASDAFGEARAAFARGIAAAYDIAPAVPTVQPRHPGLPDNPYDALETPPFFAFRADWPGMDPGPRGFAAADGRIVAARSADAIRGLLEAAGMAQSPPPANAIVRRLMWLYQPDPANRLIEWHSRQVQVAPPVVERNTDGAIRIVWFVERGGRTGFVGVYRAEFVLPPGNGPRFTESLLQ